MLFISSKLKFAIRTVNVFNYLMNYLNAVKNKKKSKE